MLKIGINVVICCKKIAIIVVIVVKIIIRIIGKIKILIIIYHMIFIYNYWYKTIYSWIIYIYRSINSIFIKILLKYK